MTLPVWYSVPLRYPWVQRYNVQYNDMCAINYANEAMTSITDHWRLRGRPVAAAAVGGPHSAAAATQHSAVPCRKLGRINVRPGVRRASGHSPPRPHWEIFMNWLRSIRLSLARLINEAAACGPTVGSRLPTERASYGWGGGGGGGGGAFIVSYRRTRAAQNRKRH